MPGAGLAPSTSSPNSLSSYSDSCLPQGLQIPNTLSISRVPNQMGLAYPTTVNAHGMIPSNKTMNIMANAPWMNPGMAPGGPHMHPHYPHMTPAMLEEMNKKKRGRPRKGNMEGMPGRPRGPKSKEDDKDMYDFEEDDSKAMQPLRPRRHNAQPANYKDPDSDEDGKQRLAQAPMIHATQGFRQIQENTVGLTQVDGFGQHPALQETPGEENQQQGEGTEGEKDEKSVSYTCSKIEETPTGGIKLKIKLKKSASPVPTDPEPPIKKPKTNSIDGVDEVGKDDSSIMSTMNEMQRLASGINRPSPSSHPHPNVTGPQSPHMMRTGMMKAGIPGGMEQRNQTAPHNMNNQMMLNGPNNPVSNSPRNPDEASRMGASAFPKVNNPYAMHSNYPNQGSHINNPKMNTEMQQHQQQMSQQQDKQPQHLQHQRQQQQPLPQQPQQQQQNFPQNNYNNYNMGYNNYMDPRQQQHQQQMYSRQQYEQHLQSFRPGLRPGGPGGPVMNMRPGAPGQGFLPQQQQPHMSTGLRYQQHGGQGMGPGQGMDPMSRMANMGPGMDPRMHHPGMTPGGMMRPMMGPGSPGMRPGHPGHMPGYPGSGPAPGSPMTSHTNMSREPAGPNMMNNSNSVISPVMPPNISPGSIHPQHPSRSPHVQDRQLFQNNQFRMSSPQYQGQSHSNFNNSSSYPGTPNSQGYPPTPGAYPQPLTPGGHQKPPTPQSIGNPPTPQGSIQNPLTPGSYPNPTTPGSYPNPTTPGSTNPLTPQPQLQESPVSHQHPVNNSQPAALPGQSQFNHPKSESVIQSNPIQNIFKDTAKMTNPMLSPPSSLSTSDLRKIRRPSKSVTPGTVSPNQKNLSPNQIKTEIKQDPEHFEVKKEAPSPIPPTPEISTASVIKAEPVVAKMEKPPSPRAPPPSAKTPEPPREPRWGEDGPDGMPERALQRVFQYVCYSQGCLPFLLSAMRMCKLWCKVAKEPVLWTHANLGNKIKEKARTEKNLEWILKNKFSNALEVDVCNWRAAISSPALKIIAANCPNLRGLGLSQCVKLSHEDVRIIPSLFPNLHKIDVSCVAVSYLSYVSYFSKNLLAPKEQNVEMFN